MNLLERVKKDMRATSSLMDGRIKGEVKTETVYVVKDFAILNDKKNNSEYTVFVSEGSPNNFYFGGTVVTDKFKRIKVGISKNNIEQVAYVIGKFSKEEMQKLDDVKMMVNNIIDDYLKMDFEKVMSKYNKKNI